MIFGTIEAVPAALEGRKYLWWPTGLDVAFGTLVLRARFGTGRGSRGWCPGVSLRARESNARIDTAPTRSATAPSEVRERRSVMTIETVVERAAGLDIAKASLVACVRTPKPDGGWQVSKRKFATMSSDVGALADWLAEHRVTRVGMESTSDYWRPVFYLLEDRFECWLLNARHMRAVPGRKTDMTDAEWICDLVAHGLVRPSFVPPPPIRRLRDLTRRRSILLADRSREKQRMEKLLEDAGVKLSVVASDIFSKSGRAMLDALIAGERDPACWPSWPG